MWMKCETPSWSMQFFLMALFYHTGYIGEFEIIDDHRAGKIVVNLTGRLNKVNAYVLNLFRWFRWYKRL